MTNAADYDLIYQTETDRAICVRRDDDGEDFWLPKSQIETDGKLHSRGQAISVTIPDWLAEKHDLA